MRRRRRISPQDAERILSGTHVPDEELGRLSALIHTTRDAYLETPGKELEARHLSAITEALGEAGPLTAAIDTAPEGGKRKMTVLIGKLAAAGLAAVLGMSGLAYAGVPFVPNPVKAVVDVTTDGDENAEAEHEGDLPEGAQEGKATAEAKRDAAKRFSEAMQVWTDCVAEKAPQQEESGAEGDFDPEAACDPKPNPQDEEFDPLTEPPAEQGQAGQEQGEQMRQEHQPPDTPDEESHPSGQDHPTGPPDGTPGGPPEGAPAP